jgi:hypothetical protein
LHPEKTKIVYCRDANRRGDFPDIRFDFLGFQFRARKTMWTVKGKRIFTDGFLPAVSPRARTGNPQLGAASPQRQIPERAGRDLQSNHSRLDYLLQPLLSDAVASDASQDRRLCHSVGSPQVQADGAPDQGSKGVVRPAAPSDTEALCSLAFMPWQRPDIGSRVTREGHARFWERPGVKLPWATRQSETPKHVRAGDSFRRKRSWWPHSQDRAK